MKRTADRLFGDDYVFSVLGAGRNQMPVATQSLLDGRPRAAWAWRTRCGTAPGRLAQSNAQQVQRIRSILEALSPGCGHARTRAPRDAQAQGAVKPRAEAARRLPPVAPPCLDCPDDQSDLPGDAPMAAHSLPR
jgi:hypothetical protein